ncbi:unnamed protein product [Zymoseptoria tritici ST99CH_3D1]|nr:unnamed protein product [Zymoseptoria tritici ST99CH_3D1]
MAVYLLDFLSVKELLRLRQVSKVWMKMIDGSTKYRKAAFLEAEVPGDPNFRASLLQPTIGSKTRDEQTSIDQRTVIPRQLFAIDVPMRSVRVNPLLFLTTHNQETDTLIPLLPLQSYGSSFMNDKSTCMDMFLTQPPIKEVRVEVRDSAVPVFGFPRLGGSRRRQVRHRNDGEEFTTLATDRDGLRFRDLHEHFSCSTDATGDLQPCPISRQNGYIPRCRVIRKDAHRQA